MLSNWQFMLQVRRRGGGEGGVLLRDVSVVSVVCILLALAVVVLLVSCWCILLALAVVVLLVSCGVYCSRWQL